MSDDKKPLSPELRAWEQMVQKDNAREQLEKAAEALRKAQATSSPDPATKSKQDEQREKIAAWEKARSEASKQTKDSQETSYKPIAAGPEIEAKKLTTKEKSELKKWEKEAKILAKAEEQKESRPRASSTPAKMEGNNELPRIEDIKKGAKKKGRSIKSLLKAARKEAVKAEISVRERSKSDPTPTTTKLESSSRSIRSESLESARSPRQGGITKGLKGILDRVKDGLNAQKTTYVDRTSSKHNKPNQGRF